MMSEREFEQIIREAAVMRSWLLYHTRDSRRSPAGFPDLVLTKNGRLIFAELKTDTGRVTNEQKTWIHALEQTDAEVYVWRPGQLDAILRTLGIGQSVDLQRGVR